MVVGGTVIAATWQGGDELLREELEWTVARFSALLREEVGKD